jgi:hypothetical protein
MNCIDGLTSTCLEVLERFHVPGCNEAAEDFLPQKTETTRQVDIATQLSLILHLLIVAMTARSQSLLLPASAVGSVASPVSSRDAVAPNTSIALAATIVLTDSSTGVDLFDVEAVQLIEEILKKVDAQANGTDMLALVGFENTTEPSVTALSRRSGACKAFQTTGTTKSQPFGHSSTNC